jgi:hypothetical protein
MKSFTSDVSWIVTVVTMEKSLRAYQSVKFNYKNNNKYISVSRVISFLSDKKKFSISVQFFSREKKSKILLWKLLFI